jgi:hypothetical protein
MIDDTTCALACLFSFIAGAGTLLTVFYWVAVISENPQEACKLIDNTRREPARITAKYPDRCHCGCDVVIEPGQYICYYGHREVYHWDHRPLAAEIEKAKKAGGK